MSHLDSKRRKPAAAAVLVLLLACIGLAACGSSSKSSSTSTVAATTGTIASTGTGARGPNASRFAAVRACLQKNGITLPQRPKPGQRPAPGQGIPGLHLPKGMTQAQYQGIVKKCGFSIRPGGLARGRGLFGSAAAKQALAKFASCMRENGVNMPAPNTSGSGPIFSSKGLNMSSPQFQAAEVKCRSVLSGAFKRGPGTGRPGGGAPPSGGAGAAPPAG